VGKGKKDKRAKGKSDKVAKLPKKKCCVTAPKCNRCPLRMLKEGTLPEGYTVHRRKLVKTAKSESGKREQGRKKNKKIAA
jgi:hypothetical protein